MPPTRSVIIAATPRSGSTLLCSLFRATDPAGRPESWFRWQNREDFTADFGLPPGSGFRTFLPAAIRAGQSPNGTFGLRLMTDNRAELMRDLRDLHGPLADRDLIARSFGAVLFVWLARRDTLAQAISRHRAEASGLWHRKPDGSPLELFGDAPAPVDYDARRIAAYKSEAEADTDNWRDWFAQAAITPVRLWYEDLAHDPLAAFRALCEQLDLPAVDLSDIAPGTARLADGTTQRWAERFRAEEAGHAL